MTSEERRAVIMEVAIKLFSERGFRGTTTRALAEAVGVSEPVLYEHFKSKRDLYQAIVEVKSKEGLARATALLQPFADSRDDRAFLITLGQFISQCYSEDQAYGRLLLLAALEGPELGDIFYERHKEAREALAGFFAERIRDGAFSDVDPGVAARVFLGMLSQYGLSRMLYRDASAEGNSNEVVEQMVDIFLRGIAR
jgi:AcrR family transcriptional regulator